MWPRVRGGGGLWAGRGGAGRQPQRWPRSAAEGGPLWFGAGWEDLGRNSAAERRQITPRGRPACLPAAGLRGVLCDGGPSRRRGFVCHSLGLGKGVSLDAQSAADGREGEEAAAEAGHFDSSVSSRHVLQRRLVPGSPAPWCTGTGPAQARATPLVPLLLSTRTAA